MTTTAPVARFLHNLPEPIAAGILDTITEACARDPVSGPGIRCVLPGLVWRLESHNCHLGFGIVNGEPLIATARIVPPKPAPTRRRPSRTATRRMAR